MSTPPSTVSVRMSGDWTWPLITSTKTHYGILWSLPRLLWTERRLIPYSASTEVSNTMFTSVHVPVTRTFSSPSLSPSFSPIPLTFSIPSCPPLLPSPSSSPLLPLLPPPSSPSLPLPPSLSLPPPLPSPPSPSSLPPLPSPPPSRLS